MYLISQPQDQLLLQLEKFLAARFNTFTFVVAYAKRSGVQLIESSLESFIQGGGRIKAIIGIDQKNTSIEALQDLRRLCTEVHVFHCEDFTQTFHPKLYFFDEANIQAELIVGSNNFTNGGFQRNTELSVGISLRYADPGDRELIRNIDSIIESYLQDQNLCKLLTEDLLQTLIEREYVLPEARISESNRQLSEAPEGRSQVFGRGRPLNNLRNPSRPAPSRSPVSTTGRSVSTNVPTGRGFWKKLRKNDVSLTSSPGQIIIPIRFSAYFPFNAFETKPNGAQQAECHFPLHFIDSSGDTHVVDGARAIRYKPAPNHPRQNTDIRFTFLSREVSHFLAVDDILRFEELSGSPATFEVRQIKPTNPDYNNYRGRYDFLP